MNLALDRYADNPIIDELVYWPPDQRRMESVRASCVLFRKPFIEVEMEDGEVYHRHFARESFSKFWAEACVILDTITSIKQISEFDFEPIDEPEKFVQEILTCRDECIEESNLMFAEGMYSQFLIQYGEDCKNLPAQTVQKISQAKQQLGQAD
jgi:hypothetical protein